MNTEYIPLIETQTFLHKIRENKKHFDEKRALYVEQKIKEWLSANTNQSDLAHDTKYLIETIECQSKIGQNNWKFVLTPNPSCFLKCVQFADTIIAKMNVDKLLKDNKEFLKEFTAYLRKTYTILMMNLSQKTSIPVHETRNKDQTEGLLLSFENGVFCLHVWY